MKFHLAGSLISKARISSGVSQVDLAKGLGYAHSQFISNWERGWSLPPPNKILKLCEIIKLNKKSLCHAILDDEINAISDYWYGVFGEEM